MPELTDETLTVLAIVLELGIPLAVLAVYIKHPRSRPIASVLLGALTPAILFYVWFVAGASLSSPREVWALAAVWVMSFLPFAALAIFGGILSLVPKPRNLGARFAVGLLVAPACVLGAGWLYDAVARSSVA